MSRSEFPYHKVPGTTSGNYLDVIKKARLAATSVALIAVPGAAELVIEGTPTPAAILGGVAASYLTGTTLFSGHQYYWNNSAPRQPQATFIEPLEPRNPGNS